jgi:hypothetical protein
LVWFCDEASANALFEHALRFSLAEFAVASISPFLRYFSFRNNRDRRFVVENVILHSSPPFIKTPPGNDKVVVDSTDTVLKWFKQWE